MLYFHFFILLRILYFISCHENCFLFFLLKDQATAAAQVPHIYPSPTKISHIGFNVAPPQYTKAINKKQTDDSNQQQLRGATAPDEPKLDLPDVPTDVGDNSFDDLSKRFENLKKK
jgi:hypothetical protein